MKSLLGACARVTLWCSVAAICALTFVWPFIVSQDPGQPAFKLAAIAVLMLFFLSMLALLVERVALKH